MALATHTLSHKQAKHTTSDMQSTKKSTEQYEHQQLSYVSSLWTKMFTSKHTRERGHWVPTLSGILKAGDEGIFSSGLLTTLHGHPGEVSLQALYEVFAEDLRARPMAERSAYSGDIVKFISSTKRVTNGPKRVQSVSHKTTTKNRIEGSVKTSRMSLDLSVAERGLVRSISMRKAAPTLAPIRNGLPRNDKEAAAKTSWMKDGRLGESLSGDLSVKISPVELEALSIVLGSPITVDRQTSRISSRKGAFNISISSSLIGDCQHQIILQRHKRNIPQSPARGSGLSPLFAKHLAAGSLPYSQDKKAVHSILIGSHTLQSVQKGVSLYLHDYNFKTPQSKFLALLPSSRESRFYIASASTKPQSSNPLINAIGALPFVGGLVPLASSPVVKTVRYIASGGLPPARLLQRLEGLVDKVHRHAPQLNIFGSMYESQYAALLYRERQRLGKLATGANVPDTLADKASRIQRYITLLERLMALVPDMKPQEVLATVQDATKTELELSYIDAVAAHQNNSSATSVIMNSHSRSDSNLQNKRLSMNSRASTDRSSDASLSTFDSPSSSRGHQPPNLGREVENILKAELPLSVGNLAVVARLILVAWTLSVDIVAWEEGEEGHRLPSLDQLPENMILC